MFTDNRFSRAHRWHFDGGADVPGSASPLVVPPPLSDPAAIDPEEAFVAAIASCHMLWFLALAARAGFVVDHYRDARRSQGRTGGTLFPLKTAMLRTLMVFWNFNWFSGIRLVVRKLG